MAPRIAIAVPVLALLASYSTPSDASDHSDGVKTAVDPAADLTDLFTFTSPTNPDKLVMVLNVNFLASSQSRFSDAVDYKFRIRPIDDAKTLVPSADPKREQSIVCSFTGGLPFVAPKQRATCKFNFGTSTETVSFDTRGPNFKAGGVGEQGGLRVFAGVRSDPWFIDIKKTGTFDSGKPIERADGTNGLQGKNVLSIVVELDRSRLAGPLLAITVQTVRR